MKPPIWQVYDWLQTESAYPEGPLPAATCHVRRAASLGFGVKAPHTALVIGPATYSELASFKKAAQPEHLRSITCFERELSAIRDDGFDIRLMDMHDMGWSTGLFDLVFSSNVLEHAFSPYGALLEIRRVLKPGAMLYSVIPTFDTDGGGNTPWHVHCFDLKHWRQLHHWTGFAIDFCDEVFEPSVPARYYHIRAKAVEPPKPHDEALARLIMLKGAVAET